MTAAQIARSDALLDAAAALDKERVDGIPGIALGPVRAWLRARAELERSGASS